LSSSGTAGNNIAMVKAQTLPQLLKEIRRCDTCAAHLPHGVRPVVQAGSEARLLIIGQAPGRRVHETGIPWNDPSGDRLREWLGITKDMFYDERHVTIMPAGFCFPGMGRSGDLPPRRECAPLWHPRLLAALPQVRLTLLIGRYAQDLYLSENHKDGLTATVAAYADCLPAYFPLPHPSPRNRLWLKNNPWFEQDVLPELRRRVRELLGTT
jgi:uracil-DNA glycosylase